MVDTIKELQCIRCKKKVKELHDSLVVKDEKICKDCLKKEQFINYD